MIVYTGTMYDLPVSYYLLYYSLYIGIMYTQTSFKVYKCNGNIVNIY